MKRILAFILMLLTLSATSLLFVSCESQNAKTVTINVYNWGQYISDGSEDTFDTNREFEIYWNETSRELYGESLADKYGYKIAVNYSTYASNEDMYNKIVSGSARYDVIIPSDYMIDRLISEDLLYPYSPSETIANYEYIDNNFRHLFYDPDGLYSVPYAYGVVGVIYNTDYIDETADGFGTWNLLWNSKYSGKILQYNNPRDAFGTAQYKLGIDVNTKDHDEWQRALDELKKQKPLVQSYVMDEIFNKMTTSSAWIASYYAGDFITMYGDNDSLDFYYPQDGTNIYIDAMCIPKNAEHKDAAIEYINYMLSEEAAVANAEYTCYATPNRLVYENDEYRAYLEDCYEGAYDMLYCNVREIDNETDYSDTDYVHVSYYRAMENTEENGYLVNYTNELWETLKIEDDGAAWVYITAAVIVAVLIGLAAYSFILRKYRESKY